MFALRIAGLALLVALSYSMGQSPPSQLNGLGIFIAGLFFVVAPALYLWPTVEASLRQHPNLAALAALNVLLGWTLLGWVAALVWALRRPEPATPVSSGPMKTCPYCAEPVLAAAIKCKHCGSALPPMPP